MRMLWILFSLGIVWAVIGQALGAAAGLFVVRVIRAAAGLEPDAESEIVLAAIFSVFGSLLASGVLTDWLKWTIDKHTPLRHGDRYGRPAWNHNSVQIDGKPVRVTQTEVWSSPWVKLTHFSRNMADMRKAGRRDLQPAVLIVAPLSGHYATLLRGTVEAFLQDHEVFITDWSNARDVPLHAGRFDFHDYLDHVREMLRLLGPRPHVVAVCQPGPAVLAAAALMAQDNEDCRPGTMTFMGSPIDARLSPTVTNKLAEERPFAWFKSNMIDTVPAPYPGLGRRVYPGFVQLYSFMSMNAEKHQDAHKQYLEDLMKGDGDATDKHLEFYDEYLSVLDLPEELYLQTVD